MVYDYRKVGCQLFAISATSSKRIMYWHIKISKDNEQFWVRDVLFNKLLHNPLPQN